MYSGVFLHFFLSKRSLLSRVLPGVPAVEGCTGKVSTVQPYVPQLSGKNPITNE